MSEFFFAELGLSLWQIGGFFYYCNFFHPWFIKVDLHSSSSSDNVQFLESQKLSKVVQKWISDPRVREWEAVMALVLVVNNAQFQENKCSLWMYEGQPSRSFLRTFHFIIVLNMFGFGRFGSSMFEFGRKARGSGAGLKSGYAEVLTIFDSWFWTKPCAKFRVWGGYPEDRSSIFWAKNNSMLTVR